MKAHTLSVFQVFDGSRRYVIPLFQRHYVWNRERQWAPLWEDLHEQAEELFEQQENAPPHFLGAIVISQIRGSGFAVQAFDVIDGQQRLTTFQIVLAAFRDVARAQGEFPIAEGIHGYTRNSGMMEDAAVERYKVWPTQADIPQFTSVMSLGSRVEVEKKYPPILKRKKLQPRPSMVEAYLFFYERIQEYITQGEEEISLRLQTLYHALNKRLQLVAIELEGNDDPQVIFETLNARGAPLLPSDLLRNFVFLRAARGKEDSQALYTQYWTPFDIESADDGDSGKSFWKEEERQGRIRRSRLDIFMQHFLALKTSREVKIGHLFQEYKRWILEREPYEKVAEELEDLTRYARVFRSFFSPNLETRVGLFVERLRHLDTSTVYPLLLELLVGGSIPQVELDGIVTDLESYLVRRMICGRTTKNYNRLFLQLLRDFFRNPSPSRQTFQGLLLALDGEANDWPNDATFRRAWLESPVYDLLQPWRVELVLRALERALWTEKNEKVTIHSKLTIEHVMPRAWETHWPLPDGKLASEADDDEAAAQRDRMLHTLGNLTLLTQSLNSSVSNGPFSSKRAEITVHGLLKLNAYFQKVSQWDEGTIRTRGLDLFEVAKKIWPHPGRAGS